MKGCELCGCPARMYCESDQASLCWDCDAKVHGANFLVARHSRSLLCHVCRSPTPWRASGAKLGHTVSVCERCDDEYDDDDDVEDEEEEEEEDDDFGGDDEDGDNQVVPWSSTPPPPEASSSSSEESLNSFSSGNRDVPGSFTMLSLKRMRETASDLRSQDDFNRPSSQPNYASARAAAARSAADDGEAISEDALRPFKDRRIEQNRPVQPQAGSRTAEIVDSLNRLHNQDITSGSDASSIIAGICNLSKQSGAVDLDCSSSRSRRI
ncbi:unnamed protein product, partial [Vitis vinifera]